MATTIRQVAAAAGVPIATASRALSDSPMGVEETKQRVQRVAAELDYTPRRVAKSLATGTTGNIGVILPDVTNPFYIAFLAELESAAAARDMGVFVGDSHEQPEFEQLLVRHMTSPVDALVPASSRLPDDAILSATRTLPVVLANRRLDDVVTPAHHLCQITIDVEPGYREAVAHLHALGHRHMAHLDGPSTSWSGQRKCEALTRICAELDMELRVIASPGGPDFTSGRHGLSPRNLTHPSAVMTFNDQMAPDLMSAMRQAGVTVGVDASAIGCDDPPHRSGDRRAGPHGFPGRDETRSSLMSTSETKESP